MDQKSVEIIERLRFKAFWVLVRVTFQNLKTEKTFADKGGSGQTFIIA